jgi:hypothetical protein
MGLENILQGKNYGIHDIGLDMLELNPDNERQTWRLDKLTDLTDSIRRTGGNITPGIVELLSPPARLDVDKVQEMIGSVTWWTTRR